jgi:hypothetical protein
MGDLQKQGIRAWRAQAAEAARDVTNQPLPSSCRSLAHDSRATEEAEASWKRLMAGQDPLTGKQTRVNERKLPAAMGCIGYIIRSVVLTRRSLEDRSCFRTEISKKMRD